MLNKGLVTAICQRCPYLLGLTKSLQAEAKDIVEVVTEVDNLKDILSNVRENDVYHDQWFGEVDKMCDSIRVQSSLPRRCGRQCHRSNIPAQDPSEFYQHTFTIPILDHLLSEIEYRFSVYQKTLYLDCT